MTGNKLIMDLIRPISEDRRKIISELHRFIPGCPVKIISENYTRNEGWAGSDHKGAIDKEGIVTEIHKSVNHAIKVAVKGYRYADSNWHYWHYNDLRRIDIEHHDVKSELFDINNLYVG